VSFYHYIHDRVSGANQIPQLADLIDERAQELNLDCFAKPTSGTIRRRAAGVVVEVWHAA
jgi:hypothetical protein